MRTLTVGKAATTILAAVALGCLGTGDRNSESAARASGTGSVPTHVITYLYFGRNDGKSGLRNVPASVAAKFVTWGMVNQRDSHALAAAGIKTMYYTNPNRVSSAQPLYVEDESEFAHDCSNQRILSKGSVQGMYLTDPASQTLRRKWHDYVADLMAAGHYDAIYNDTSAEIVKLGAKPCGWNWNSWIASHVDFIKSEGFPVFYNGLMDLQRNGPGYSSYSLSPIMGLNAAPNVLGGSFEGCYASNARTSGKTSGAFWQQTENTEIAMQRQRKIMICNMQAVHRMSPEDAVDQRSYAYASFLLTYDLGSTMVRQQFRTSDGFDLEPETELVALSPLVSTPNDIAALHTSGGSYAREYGACYIAGVSVGPCAAVVNADPADTEQFPFSKYHHSLRMSGGGILEGGQISADGPQPGALAPMTGVIAFQ